MGKIYDTLRHNGARPEPVEEKDVVRFGPPGEPGDDSLVEIPFIEVGGRKAVLEASPEVLASMVVPANKPPKPRREEPVVAAGVRAAEPAKEMTLRVVYRPLNPEATLPPAHLRFAPGLIAFHQPAAPAARQYQTLAHTLGLPAGDTRVVLLTAPAPGSGTTSVLLNLALIVARPNGPRVAVVDANFSRPDVAVFLGLPDRPGLHEVLLGTVSLADALQESGLPNLSVLTVGGGCGRRFAAERFAALVQELRAQFDVVLVDGPPPDARAETGLLASACDAVHAVVPQREADAEGTLDYLRALALQRCPVRGQILTQIGSRE